MSASMVVAVVVVSQVVLFAARESIHAGLREAARSIVNTCRLLARWCASTAKALQERNAEMLLEVENAHAATYYAAWAQDAAAEDRALAASVAKAYVSDAARKVCGEAIQVHGGIGFTWEYDLHLYFKRAKTLEATWGDADYHRELIVRQVAG